MRTPTINRMATTQLVTILLVIGIPNTENKPSGAGETAAFATGSAAQAAARTKRDGSLFFNRILTAEQPKEAVLLIDRFARVNSLNTIQADMI